MTSEFKAWRLASGYTYDKRQEQAWNAATRAERERCAGKCDEHTADMQQRIDEREHKVMNTLYYLLKGHLEAAQMLAAAIREGE